MTFSMLKAIGNGSFGWKLLFDLFPLVLFAIFLISFAVFIIGGIKNLSLRHSDWKTDWMEGMGFLCMTLSLAVLYLFYEEDRLFKKSLISLLIIFLIFLIVYEIRRYSKKQKKEKEKMILGIQHLQSSEQTVQMLKKKEEIRKANQNTSATLLNDFFLQRIYSYHGAWKSYYYGLDKSESYSQYILRTATVEERREAPPSRSVWDKYANEFRSAETVFLSEEVKKAGKEILQALRDLFKEEAFSNSDLLFASLGSLAGKEGVVGLVFSLFYTNAYMNETFVTNSMYSNAGIDNTVYDRDGELIAHGERVSWLGECCYEAITMKRIPLRKEIDLYFKDVERRIALEDEDRYFTDYEDNIKIDIWELVRSLCAEERFDGILDIYCKNPFDRLMAYAAAVRLLLKNRSDLSFKQRALDVFFQYFARTASFCLGENTTKDEEILYGGFVHEKLKKEDYALFESLGFKGIYGTAPKKASENIDWAIDRKRKLYFIDNGHIREDSSCDLWYKGRIITYVRDDLRPLDFIGHYGLSIPASIWGGREEIIKVIRQAMHSYKYLDGERNGKHIPRVDACFKIWKKDKDYNGN